MAGWQADDAFNLPVEIKGKEIILTGTLVQRGYSYKIHIEVDGHLIIFEPDEERNFRAINENPSERLVSADIIIAIAAALEKHLR